MSTIWLSVIGVTEAGIAALPPTERTLVQEAEVIIGPDRLVAQCDGATQTIVKWKKSIAAMVEQVQGFNGRKTVILASGDPFWFGIGATLSRYLQTDEFAAYPAISSFQLAASRMHWPLQNVATITLHGRPVENLVRHLAPGQRILALTSDAKTLDQAVEILENRGFGASQLTVLENLGGPDEKITISGSNRSDSNANHSDSSAKGTTNRLDSSAIGDFYVLAIDCVADEGASIFSPAPGLADEMFENDGQLTKSHVRATTLSRLKPYKGALLWDVGAGSGAIGIEFMRACDGAQTIAFEANPTRAGFVRNNAARLGVPGLTLIEGAAPDCLTDQPQPDAIFQGCNVADKSIFEACWAALRPGGVLVTNAVTLAAERALLERQAEYGGDLTRISISTLEHVGPVEAFKPRISVLQWHIIKEAR